MLAAESANTLPFCHYLSREEIPKVQALHRGYNIKLPQYSSIFPGMYNRKSTSGENVDYFNFPHFLFPVSIRISKIELYNLLMNAKTFKTVGETY
jgi:hypothetical protein